MSILYIGKSVLDDLMNVCSRKLLWEVLNDLADTGKVIYSNDVKQHPTKFLQIDADYLSVKSQVSVINKLQVVFAFINVGGVVELFGQKFIDSSILAILQNKGLISEEELAILNDPWFNYNMGGNSPMLDLII